LTPFILSKDGLAGAQALADKKKDVMDEDILALVSDEVHQPEKLWDLLDLQVGVKLYICTICPRMLGL
jgi:2-isopropylmalate synthase